MSIIPKDKLLKLLKANAEAAGLASRHANILDATVVALGETVRLLLQGVLQDEMGDGDEHIQSLLSSTKKLHEVFEQFPKLTESLNSRIDKLNELVELLRDAIES